MADSGCQRLILDFSYLDLSLHTSPAAYLHLTLEGIFRETTDVEGMLLGERLLLRFVCGLSKTSQAGGGRREWGGRKPTGRGIAQPRG